MEGEMKVPLSFPYFDREELQEVASVLGSGWVSRGPKCRELEGVVAGYLEDPDDGPMGKLHCVTLANCTAALHLALLALDVGRGDEVIVPDFTFPATAMAVLYAGARPVFVDVLEDTYCMDPRELAKAVTPRTKAVIPVHLFGHPADMDPILEVAKDNHLYVVEDAACALGAEYRGRKVGDLGDIACFSLHGRKVITTGEGGLLVTRNMGIANRVRDLSQFGISGAWERSNGGFEVPQFISLGYNFKMSDIQAAVGVAQMRKIDAFISHRTRLASEWGRTLGDFPGRLPGAVGDVRHAWQNYMAVVEGHDRNEIILGLRDKGVEAGIGTYSCLEQPLFRAHERRGCPVSRDLFYRGVSMPMPWGVTVERI